MMGNQFVTRHYQVTLPDNAVPDNPNKSAEMPAHTPNVSKVMPGEKPKGGKPKTLKHVRWTAKRHKRRARSA
jgi:hypothetical protein